MQAVSASGQEGKSHNGGGDYFDGCLAHLHYVDGQAYAPTVLGETDSTSGIWKYNIINNMKQMVNLLKNLKMIIL